MSASGSTLANACAKTSVSRRAFDDDDDDDDG